jgi:hypothetical protein
MHTVFIKTNQLSAQKGKVKYFVSSVSDLDPGGQKELK